MENEIRELIVKWENRREGIFSEAAYLVLEDLESLLKFKQKNCCGNFVIESAAYNRGHHDGYMQAKNEEYK